MQQPPSADLTRASTPSLLGESDFSLVLGGPLYQMLRRGHLSGQALELVRRRIFALLVITWLPLFLLCARTGTLFGGEGLSFLRDVETHVRFVISLPMLLLAELVVHKRLRVVVQSFLDREIIGEEDRARFRSAIEKTMRIRNSAILEIAILIFAFTVGHYAWTREVALERPTWYSVPEGSEFHLTLPGYWYAFLSIPVAQFLIFRWYMRILLWFSLLWRISRLKLQLIPTDPDRAGGIGFLGESTYAFVPILFAQGAALSGVIAGRIFYDGQNLLSFRMTVAALVLFFVLVILGPLTVFTPQLERARRLGLKEYGMLAHRYVRDFDVKWVREEGKDKAILGTADLQSLADLGNSFTVVRDMRLLPFTLRDVLVLVGATALPVVPLVLAAMPLEEVVSRLSKVIL